MISIMHLAELMHSKKNLKSSSVSEKRDQSKNLE